MRRRSSASPQRSKKRNAQGRRRPTEGVHGSFEDALAEPLFEEILEEARQLPSLRSPFEAEAWASGLVSTWQSLPSIPGLIDPDEVFGRGLVRHAESEASSKALALLSAVAAVARSQVADAARAAAGRLRGRGIHSPAWAEALGTASFSNGWLGAAPGCPQEAVVGVFDYGGASSHALGVLIDYQLGGVIKDAFIAPDADELLARSKLFADIRLRPVSGAVVAGRIKAGLEARERFGAGLQGIVDDDVKDLAPFISARLRTLPSPEPGPAAPWPSSPTDGRHLWVAGRA